MLGLRGEGGKKCKGAIICCSLCYNEQEMVSDKTLAQKMSRIRQARSTVVC